MLLIGTPTRLKSGASAVRIIFERGAGPHFTVKDELPGAELLIRDHGSRRTERIDEVVYVGPNDYGPGDIAVVTTA